MATLDEILDHCGIEKRDLVRQCPRDVRIKLAVKLVDWKVFGAFLGFPREKLASIDAENRTEDQRKIALLDSWHERESEDATSLKLAELLYERNRRDLVSYLCHELKSINDHQGSASISASGGERLPTSADVALSHEARSDSWLDEVDSGDITDRIEELEEEFDALHKGLLSDIKVNEAISVEEFLQALTLLPISLRREYESSIQEKLTTLERIPTINGMFLRLNPLFSFLDYGLLEHLVRKFGGHALKQGMTSYVAKINVFMSETTVAQLMDCWPGLEESPATFSQLRVKFDEDPTHYTLKKLDRFRKKFCGHIRLSHFVLLLIRIEAGSFYAIWCVPPVLIPELMKSAKQINTGFYHYERILSITVNGDCIYQSATQEATNILSKQVVLFPLDQEYLTCKSDGYFEERDYRIQAHLGSTMLVQDLTTRAQFSIGITIGGSSPILNECHILSRLGKHRNVIRFLGGVAEELESPTGPIQECRMMYESTKDGSLADMLIDENGYMYPLDGNQSMYYLHQILSGVQFLHRNNVLHLDICAENLQLFDRGCTIKLTGFERATSVDANTGITLKDSQHLSTFFSAAPEVVREEVPSTAADIWSVMCTMVHMITGRWMGCIEAPRPAVTMFILVGSYSDDLLQKLIPLDKLELDIEVAQLFIDVFKKDPSLRPTAEELLKRPIIHLAQEYEECIPTD